MHSFIVQISKKPIAADKRVTADRYYDNTDFLGPIADYVDDLDRDRALAQLAMGSPWCWGSIDAASATMTITDNTSYFAARYEDFRRHLDTLSRTSLQDFASGDAEVSFNLDVMLDCLKDSFDARFGLYVDDDSVGLVTFDWFMRNVAFDGAVFHIGSILDYHA